MSFASPWGSVRRGKSISPTTSRAICLKHNWNFDRCASAGLQNHFSHSGICTRSQPFLQGDMLLLIFHGDWCFRMYWLCSVSLVYRRYCIISLNCCSMITAIRQSLTVKSFTVLSPCENGLSHSASHRFSSPENEQLSTYSPLFSRNRVIYCWKWLSSTYAAKGGIWQNTPWWWPFRF